MSFEHMYTIYFNHYIRGRGNSVPPNVSVNIQRGVKCMKLFSLVSISVIRMK